MVNKNQPGISCFWAGAIMMLVSSFAVSEQGVLQARVLLQEQDQLRHKHEALLAEKLRLQSEFAEAQALTRACKEQQDAERAKAR